MVLFLSTYQCTPKYTPYVILSKGYGVYYPKPYQAQYVFKYTYYDSLGIEYYWFTLKEYNIGDTIK